MTRLKDKVIVLTGANGLLGKYFVRALLREGAYVASIDRQFDENYLGEFSDDKKICIFQVDITDQSSLERCFEDISTKFGKIDGLVNNAAINPKVEDSSSNMSGLDNLNYSNWKDELDVGLFAAIMCSRQAAKYFARNEHGGSIVNLGSDYGHLAPKQNLYKEHSKKPITYTVVKFGIVGVTKYLATYFAENKIRVNTLSPGGIANGQDRNFIEKLNHEIPLGRMAQPDEITGALIFLLSDESAYVTGLDLIVDGGRNIW